MASEGPREQLRTFQYICPLFLMLQMTEEMNRSWTADLGGSLLAWQQESHLSKSHIATVIHYNLHAVITMTVCLSVKLAVVFDKNEVYSSLMKPEGLSKKRVMQNPKNPRVKSEEWRQCSNPCYSRVE